MATGARAAPLIRCQSAFFFHCNPRHVGTESLETSSCMRLSKDDCTSTVGTPGLTDARCPLHSEGTSGAVGRTLHPAGKRWYYLAGFPSPCLFHGQPSPMGEAKRPRTASGTALQTEASTAHTVCNNWHALAA